MIRPVSIVGVGMTPFGRLEQHSVKSLTALAISDALVDAGISVTALEAAYFANATQRVLGGQLLVPGQVALRPLGIAGIPIVNVENACASGSTAFQLACAQVQSGLCDIAVAVGAEKMFHADKTRLGAIFDGAWDVEKVAEVRALLAEMAAEVSPPTGAAGGQSVFMDLYASLARAHMARHGLTARELAAVSAKNLRHAAHNERAQRRTPLSIEEILDARAIAWPLTLPMCSPISDGAAAVIVCAEDALDRCVPRAAPVRVRASIVGSGSDRDWRDGGRHISRVTAQKAYERAGVGPADVDVAEVHDASAFAEVLQTENLGFCEPGSGGYAAARGDTALGGRLPVNPSGGLECKGHPIGATGLGQLFELVTQLRGEAGPRQVQGARIALAENGGGWHGCEEAAVCVTVLAR